jgi:hypothetical protein
MPRVVLDPACGTGAWLGFFDPSVALANDLNPLMVDFARRRLEFCTVYTSVADMASFSIDGAPLADLAINLSGTVGHLSGPSRLKAHLNCVGKHLFPEAIYLLGAIVKSQARLAPAPYYVSKSIAGSHYQLSVTRTIKRTGEYAFDRMHYVLVRDNSSELSTRLVDEIFHLTSYTVEEISDAASAANFQLIAVYDMETPGYPMTNRSRAAGDCTFILKKLT